MKKIIRALIISPLMIGLLTIGSAMALTLSVAGPATAQTNDGLGGYTVSRFASDITVAADGTITVQEQIDADFSEPRHGLFRYIPWIKPLVATDLRAARYDRRYDLTDVTVEATGASAKKKVGTENGFVVIRIGDSKQTVTGPASYRISYRVKGALDPATETATLVWNAIPADWDVAKGNPQVRVHLPAAPLSIACTAGTQGSTRPCAGANVEAGNVAVFSDATLAADEGLTVTVRLPASAITPPPEILLKEKFSLTRRLGTDKPGVLGASGGLLAVLLAGVAKLARRGRDQAFVGGSLDASSGLLPTGDATVSKIPVGPPEYRPPDGLTPAELSFLITEKTSTQQVTATIVDLAVRGHLRIEELDGAGLLKRHDWRFVATPEKVKPDDRPNEYERVIMTGLFGGTATRDLSDLKNHFHTANSTAQRQIEQKAVSAKWYRSKPSTVRAKWAALGAAIAGLGVLVTVVALNASHAALVALPLVIAGLAVIVVSGSMPARTSAGSALTSRALGFKRFLEVADADMLRAAEKEGSLERHLAYASVFGIAEQWTKRLALLGVGAAAVGASNYPWWIPAGGRGFDPDHFGRSLSDFTKSAAAVLPSSPSSSGSGGGGSVGGGGGGGGGGSW